MSLFQIVFTIAFFGFLIFLYSLAPSGTLSAWLIVTLLFAGIAGVVWLGAVIIDAAMKLWQAKKKDDSAK